MDYKEKYEQALERARQFSEKPYLEDSAGIVEYIFPELKESEDEQFRKHILKCCEETIIADDGGLELSMVTTKRLKAWLEKQGEQPKKHDVCDNCDQQGGCVSPCPMKLVEKQGEQNLVNINLDELVIQLEETIGTSPHSRETVKDFFQMAVQKYMNCLRIANGEIGRLVEENYYLKEQKPAEWGEEDEQHIDSLLKRLKGLCGNVFERTRFAISEDRDWLKSLRPQNKWISVDKEVYVKEPVLAQKKDKSDPFKGYVVCCDHTLIPNVYERYMILGNIVSQNTSQPSDEHYELEEFAKIVRGNLTGISEAVQELFEAKYLQLTGNKMYGGFKD